MGSEPRGTEWVANEDLEPGMVYFGDDATVTVKVNEDFGTWVEDDAGNKGYVNSKNKVEVYR